MNPKPFLPVILPTSVTAAVVRQLDEQLLQSVEDESLSSAQQAELLRWAHGHLLCAYVALHLDAFPDPTAESAQELLIEPCTSAIEIIGNMLQGEIPLEEDMTFHCPPVCCARARPVRPVPGLGAPPRRTRRPAYPLAHGGGVDLALGSRRDVPDRRQHRLV